MKIKLSKRTLYFKLFFALMCLVFIINVLLLVTIFSQGIVYKLKENEIEITNQIVETRRNFVETEMTSNWMRISEEAKEIQTIIENKLNETDETKKVTIEGLNQNSKANSQMLLEIAPYLIDMLRNHQVNGAYIVLNTNTLVNDDGTITNDAYNKPGIYIRDEDASGKYSERNDDLSVRVAPIDAFNELNITRDISFYATEYDFDGANKHYIDSFIKPFQNAYEYLNNKTRGSLSLYEIINVNGYWNIPLNVEELKYQKLTYSIPLIINYNGIEEVVGVCGIDIDFDALRTLLPFDELSGDQSNYYLASYDETTKTLTRVCNSHENKLVPNGNYTYTFNENEYYYYLSELNIYYRNAPYSHQKWYIIGGIMNEMVYEFSNKFFISLIVACITTFIIGAIMAFVTAYIVQKPITRVVKLIQNKTNKQIEESSGIKEIDNLLDEINSLRSNLISNNKALSQIMKMARSHISGFEINYKKNKLYLTDNFFFFLPVEVENQEDLTIEEFKEVMGKLEQYYYEEESSENVYMLKIPNNDYYQYVQITCQKNEVLRYGLVEDVTKIMVEKQYIQYERDHDALTDLLNRRALGRKIHEVLEDPNKKVNIAALVMVDLDDLKNINDTYGHEFGDRYIKAATNAMRKCLKQNDIYGRISGDEFHIFLYDYKTKEEIEAKIQELHDTINSQVIKVLDGKIQEVHASSGVAWYPEHSTSIEDLGKYADYAMYIAKKNFKSKNYVFNTEEYSNQDTQIINRRRLTSLIDNQAIYYAFQPIIDVKTCEVYGYEALMRPYPETGFTVSDVLLTAREEGKLGQIETLCWIKSLESFVKLINDGVIDRESHIFINSIPNYSMDDKTAHYLVKNFGHYGPQIVVELTEGEQLNAEVWNEKQRKHKELGGKVALDDYGSGYNSEKNLLAISPDFIKVDIAIVRDIHLNEDKQSIIEYIINFAHKRGKYVIAEGVEKEEEIKTLMKLGVDYMQGYYFSKPQEIPTKIPDDVLQIIKTLRKTRKK